MASTATSASDDGVPRLPEDLERLIFESAAYEWRPRHSGKLLLVAKRVHDWVRPFVYRVFIQVQGHNFPNFRRNPLTMLDNVGKYARHLMAGDDTKQLDLLLSSCPNVQDLALWHSCLLRNHLHAMQSLRLTRLSADLQGLPPQELLTPTFYNLSHLDIINLEYRPCWREWAVLANLPKLSHLTISLDDPDKTDIIRQCLIHCKGLKIFIFLLENDFGSPESKEDLEAIDDERLVLMCHDTLKEIREVWENGLWGGLDFWITAELFVLARKKDFLRKPTLKWIGISLDWGKELNERGRAWFSTL